MDKTVRVLVVDASVNSWVTLTSQVRAGDYLATDVDTDFYQNGVKKGSIHTEIVW